MFGFTTIQQRTSLKSQKQEKRICTEKLSRTRAGTKRTAISFRTCGLRYEGTNSCSLLLSSFIDFRLILSCQQFQVSEAIYGVICTRASLHMIHNNGVFCTYAAALCHQGTPPPPHPFPGLMLKLTATWSE